MTAALIDPNRLRRAVALEVTRDRDGWIVTGGRQPHRVTQKGRRLRCDCADFLVRRTVCKHRLRVALALGNPVIIASLKRIIG